LNLRGKASELKKSPFVLVNHFEIQGRNLGLYRVKPVLLPDEKIFLDGNNDSNFLAVAPPDQVFDPVANKVTQSDFQVAGDYIGNYRFLETDWRCMRSIGSEARSRCLSGLGHIYDLKNKTVKTLTVDKNAKTIATSLEHFHGHHDGCGASGDQLMLKSYHRLEFNCIVENGKQRTYIREFEPETNHFIEYNLPHSERKRGIYLELKNGKVLILGGDLGRDSALKWIANSDVEIFDPKMRRIKTLFKLDNSQLNSAWELSDGRILMWGKARLETLDLSNGHRQQISDYDGSLRQAVELVNGNFLFAGNGKDVMLFDAKLNLLKKLGELSQERIAPLLLTADSKRAYLFGGVWCEGDCKFKRIIYNDILEYRLEAFANKSQNLKR
jgi:hypothetical protein